MLLALLMFAGARQASAQDEPDTVMTLSFSNDLFAAMDRWFTSDIAISFAMNLERRDGYELWLRSKVGQSIYTPRAITEDTPPSNDRSFVGWLYGDTSLSLVSSSSTFELLFRLGTTGEPSLGAEMQGFVHRLIQKRIPQGWGHQLSQRETYELRGFWQQKIFSRYQVSLFSFLSADVGTTRGRGSAGASLVWTWNMAPREGATMIDGDMLTVPAAMSADWGVAVQLGGLSRYVVYDEFIENDETGSDLTLMPFQLVMNAGFVVRYRSFRFRYVHNVTSPEFTAQFEPHQFGRIDLMLPF